MSDSTSVAQSSSVSFGLSKLPFKSSQSSMSERLSGALSSSHSTGWRLIVWIRWTFNLRVRSPGRSLADKAGGHDALSDSLNAAPPSCWKSVQDALTICSVSEMYRTAVFCLFRPWDSFCVAGGSWLPCHISKKLWTLAILGNVLSSTCFLISELLSVFVVSNAGSSPAKIPLLAQVNSHTMTFLRRVSPVVLDCLQPITSCQREKLDSTPTPGGMIDNVLRATLERSAYSECVSSCWHHQSVMSGIEKVLLISIGLEWYFLRFESICPQFLGASGGEFRWSLAAITERAAQSLRPGVVSATPSGDKNSSSSLDKSYGSKHDWPNHEAILEETRLLLGPFLGISTGTHRCLAQCSFSTYFYNAIHMIKHAIVDSDSMMQCDCMPLRHPQGPLSESPENFHDVLNNGPLILWCEECPVISVCWISKPLAGEFW